MTMFITTICIASRPAVDFLLFILIIATLRLCVPGFGFPSLFTFTRCRNKENTLEQNTCETATEPAVPTTDLAVVSIPVVVVPT
jgi:hypothetical protein